MTPGRTKRRMWTAPTLSALPPRQVRHDGPAPYTTSATLHGTARSPGREIVLSAEEVAVNLAAATPRRLLVDWANEQDAWVRQLVAESILSRKEPGEDTLEKVYVTFLAEKGLSGQPPPTVPTLELDAVEPARTTPWSCPACSCRLRRR